MTLCSCENPAMDLDTRQVQSWHELSSTPGMGQIFCRCLVPASNAPRLLHPNLLRHGTEQVDVTWVKSIERGKTRISHVVCAATRFPAPKMINERTSFKHYPCTDPGSWVPPTQVFVFFVVSANEGNISWIPFEQTTFGHPIDCSLRERESEALGLQQRLLRWSS